MLSRTAALSAVLILAIPALGAPKGAPRTADTRTESEDFERGAESSRRRAKALTDDLRLRGKAPFADGVGVRAVYSEDHAAARSAFGAMIDADPSSPTGYHRMAGNQFMSGDFAGAAAMYGEAMKRAGTRAEALDLLALKAEAHLQAGDVEAALADTARGVADSKAPPRLHLVRVRSWLKAGDGPAAAAAYRALLAARPRRATTSEDEAICAALKFHKASPEECAR